MRSLKNRDTDTLHPEEGVVVDAAPHRRQRRSRGAARYVRCNLLEPDAALRAPARPQQLAVPERGVVQERADRLEQIDARAQHRGEEASRA